MVSHMGNIPLATASMASMAIACLTGHLDYDMNLYGAYHLTSA